MNKQDEVRTAIADWLDQGATVIRRAIERATLYGNDAQMAEEHRETIEIMARHVDVPHEDDDEEFAHSVASEIMSRSRRDLGEIDRVKRSLTTGHFTKARRYLAQQVEAMAEQLLQNEQRELSDEESTSIATIISQRLLAAHQLIESIDQLP